MILDINLSQSDLKGNTSENQPPLTNALPHFKTASPKRPHAFLKLHHLAKTNGCNNNPKMGSTTLYVLCTCVVIIFA